MSMAYTFPLKGNGDNAFVTVAASADFDYEYQLPPGHPSGVFWYHPHLHGSVADQIFGGLYGAIIVGDHERDSEPVASTRDRVLVISDMSLDAAGNVRSATAGDRMAGREGDLVLVNGQVRPVLTARPGERERWRVVNACAARYLQLRLDGQRVQVLGIDSGRLALPRDVEEVVLARPATGPTSSSRPSAAPANSRRRPTTEAT
jgi:FtsP/CotA-like multicopper oxidase with cupredoxin domain